MNKRPSYLSFDKSSYFWKPGVDYRAHPEHYRVGIALESAQKIFAQFLSYLDKDEFVGADMARKYLQMGYTRARRYANYRGGRKYDPARDYAQLEFGTGEEEKAEAAKIFHGFWKQAEANEKYAALKKSWKQNRG
ncbi:MAG: DUF4385 family protein [Chryseobacterium sp.]|nr:MAG: DUF4385 family protein [Chryseobacterium sp.]